jgi:hypothetical protein
MESGRVGMENALAGHEEIGIDVDWGLLNTDKGASATTFWVPHMYFEEQIFTAIDQFFCNC